MFLACLLPGVYPGAVWCPHAPPFVSMRLECPVSGELLCPPVFWRVLCVRVSGVQIVCPELSLCVLKASAPGTRASDYPFSARFPRKKQYGLREKSRNIYYIYDYISCITCSKWQLNNFMA